MNVTIVGGGNIGTQFAVHCAYAGHSVTVYTSKPHLFNKKIKIIDKKNRLILEGEIKLATNNAEIAFSNADLIFITTPAFCANEIYNKICPYLKSGAYIGLIPGTGGMECVFKELIKNNCIIFGLQRVPSVARLVVYGNTVCAEGYRDKLFLGAIPHWAVKECCAFISEIFNMPCEQLPCFLNLTLTPSNPILHTTRLYTLFKDYFVGKEYPDNPLFYEDWDNETSELLFECDEEVQNLCAALNEFDLSNVKSLKIHYESQTVSQLTNKIKSIEGFKGLKTPMLKSENGYIPDFNSRYFVSDFGYGLSIINQIADLIGMTMPHITNLLSWYKSLPISQNEYQYSDYGINSYEDFKSFYLS